MILVGTETVHPAIAYLNRLDRFVFVVRKPWGRLASESIDAKFDRWPIGLFSSFLLNKIQALHFGYLFVVVCGSEIVKKVNSRSRITLFSFLLIFFVNKSLTENHYWITLTPRVLKADWHRLSRTKKRPSKWLERITSCISCLQDIRRLVEGVKGETFACRLKWTIMRSCLRQINYISIN